MPHKDDFVQNDHLKKLQIFQFCSTTVDRIKKGPESRANEAYHIEEGEKDHWIPHKYIDWTFTDRDALYVWWQNDFESIWNTELDLWSFQASQLRLSDLYPGAPLFRSGTNNGLGFYLEASQGSLANCYHSASMISFSTKPERLKNMFLT